jgi:SAM-dependent methyltransferase
MLILPRPSKIVFYRILKHMIRNAEPFRSVLDFASAGAKNLGLFRGKRYTGADINKDLQKKARKRFSNRKDVKILTADILKPRIPAKFDLVVSTHTLVYIRQIRQAVGNLKKLTSTGGCLILHLLLKDLGPELRQELEMSFAAVRYVPFRRSFSVLYERFLSSLVGPGHLGSFEGTRLSWFARKILLLFSFIISLVDVIGPGSEIIIACMERK